MRVIKISRKAGAQDYARAAAYASPVISNRDNILGLTAAGVISGVGSLLGGGKGDRIGKKKFYEMRDAFYHTAEKFGKPVQALPGNPFAKFSHAAIHDSPVKNYKDDWKAFTQMVALYYPEFILADGSIASVPVQEIKTAPVAQSKPLQPVVEKALKDAGKEVPKDYNEQLQAFGNEIVGPATGQDLSGAGSDALADAAIAFVGSLMEKKKNGEQLPAIYDKIANGGLKVEDGIERNVRKNIEGNIGAVVTDNIVLIGLGLVVLVLAVMSKK